MMNSEIISLLPELLHPGTNNASNFKSSIQEKILFLLRSRPEQVSAILYQIDIDEKQAIKAFELVNDKLIAESVAELILKRLEQKVEMRKRYVS